jgi:hypothetical protein
VATLEYLAGLPSALPRTDIEVVQFTVETLGVPA